VRPLICPVSDHDGFEAPVTRHIDAEGFSTTAGGPTKIETARCDYCAEGYIARMVRDGYRVTVWAVSA
jgi:hypothetical protein